MKKFNVYVSLLLLTLCCVAEALSHSPSQILTAYQNKVMKADVSTKGGELLISLKLDKAPICVYYPETYQESKDDMIQRFFLPRTQWHHKEMNEFIKNLDVACDQLSVDCKCHRIKEPNFGLEF